MVVISIKFRSANPDLLRCLVGIVLEYAMSTYVTTPLDTRENPKVI
jgi:hypothetical protein